MKKPAFSIATIASVLVLAGCGGQPSKPLNPVAAKPTADNSVAIVNGKPISRTVFDAIMAEMAQRNEGRAIPEDKLVDGLISRELLNQEAEKLNLPTDPAVAAKLDNARRDVLVQAMVENFRKTATVSEEEIKKEYDNRTQALKGAEFKARHILLESEGAAKDVIAKLHKGTKFEVLAKKLSKDPSAKQNGGDLGWFNPQQMVPEFSAAVAALKNGETSSAPVKSQFGWHVIQRQDSREQQRPPYDAVKEQFRSMLVGQKIQEHVEQLKASAKIERLTQPKPTAAETAAPTSLEAGTPVSPATPKPAP